MWFRRAGIADGCFAALLLVPSLTACTMLEGDRILARDLASADQVFARLEPGTEIGYAPRPGVTRVFHLEDLARLAQQHGIPGYTPRAEVCVMRATSVAAPAMANGARPGESSPPILRPDVARGDTVAVEVESGAAHLAFDAKSESSGRTGDTVLMRNPDNGRLFQARVVGKARVLIQK